MDDQKRVVETLTAVASLYKQDLAPGVISIWLQALDRFSADQIVGALTAHVTDPERGQFMPKRRM